MTATFACLTLSVCLPANGQSLSLACVHLLRLSKAANEVDYRLG